MKHFLIAIVVFLTIALLVLSAFTYLNWIATPLYESKVASILIKPGMGMRDASNLQQNSNLIALDFLIAEKEMELLNPPALKLIEHYRISRTLNQCRFAFGNWNPFSDSARNCISNYTDVLEGYMRR